MPCIYFQARIHCDLWTQRKTDFHPLFLVTVAHRTATYWTRQWEKETSRHHKKCSFGWLSRTVSNRKPQTSINTLYGLTERWGDLLKQVCRLTTCPRCIEVKGCARWSRLGVSRRGGDHGAAQVSLCSWRASGISQWSAAVGQDSLQSRGKGVTA